MNESLSEPHPLHHARKKKINAEMSVTFVADVEVEVRHVAGLLGIGHKWFSAFGPLNLYTIPLQA